MKYNHSLSLIKFFCLLVVGELLQAQNININYYAPENIYRFATSLYEEGDYLRAADEFQRYLVAFDSVPSNADSVFYKIGLCYRFANLYPKAINYFKRIIDNYPKSTLLSPTYYQIGLVYTLAGEYNKSTEFLNSNLLSINQNDIRLKTNWVIALNYLLLKEWNYTIDFINNLDSTTKQDSLTLLLTNYAKEGKRLPRKNEFLAGLFSSMIPGTGKIYCNRAWDGFFSLITIGIMGWQAYDGFRTDRTRSIKGWIFGSTTAVFYLGNIYGSVVAAKIYNEQQDEKFLNKIKLLININFR